MIFKDRKLNPIERLQNELNKNTAFIIESSINRFYFTGLMSSAGYLFVTKEKSYCLVDFRYFEAAKKLVKNCEVICYYNYKDEILNLINMNNIKSIVIENEKISLASAQKLKQFADENSIILIDDNSLDTIILNFRKIKTNDEINKIKNAQKITKAAFEHILNNLKTGVTEKQIALEIEFFMRKNGAQAMSFNPIVLFGENTSLPHGIPSDRKLKNGDLVLMDTGCVFEGYCSDMTRTVAFNFATEEQKSIYNIVLKAQRAAISEVKSGVLCSNIDKIARDIIYNAGYEGFFGHGTGHSLGLEIHESPSFSISDNSTLNVNTVITVEPGIYLPGKFGIRIEDMLVVKDGHNQNITDCEHDLIIV